MQDPVENVLFLADSYKISHYKQYPPGISHVYSYFECRGGKFPSVCFFGLQYIIKRWLIGPVVTAEMVKEAQEFYQAHFGNQDIFNVEGWMHIVEKHEGRLPLRIKAVPEGSVVPIKNVLFTVENTDPLVPWLTSWFETVLVQAWYPTTVCTNSRAQKEIIAKYMAETCDTEEGLLFKLHDFGYRGSTSVESASIGGAAHLVNFTGSDNVGALRLLQKYYACPMGGYSVPAAEHSTITAWQQSGEVAAYRNMLKQFPEGIVSVVSDSYDLFNAVSNIWGDELKEEVISRGEKGCLVIRPDSGDPKNIVVKVLGMLETVFPITLNGKGYKMLPNYIRIIHGDGICYETLDGILAAIKEAKWSVDNVIFGSGGALLQKVDRDTQKCAFKCSHVIVDGEKRDVFKNPATDSGKKSKKGLLTLVQRKGSFETIQEGRGDPEEDILVTVFEDGRLLVDWSLDEIRKRAEVSVSVVPVQNGFASKSNGSHSPIDLCPEIKN